MKLLITLLLTITTSLVLGQNIPNLVESNFNGEMSGNTSKFSKVDFNNVDQGTINKLVSKKIRFKQITNNPLTIITGGKQKVNNSAVKAAKHHTIYQVKSGRLTHTEGGEFKTFSHRYKFYSSGDFGSIMSNGEVVCSFKSDKEMTYNQLVKRIIKIYMNSKEHKKILMDNFDKGETLGSYVSINSKGWVYNTIVFP